MIGLNFKVRLNIYFIWKRVESVPVGYVWAEEFWATEFLFSRNYSLALSFADYGRQVSRILRIPCWEEKAADCLEILSSIVSTEMWQVKEILEMTTYR